jgi:rod shape-determining protein MreC
VNEVNGDIYSVSSEVKSYINLRQFNNDLSDKVAALEKELYATKQQLDLVRDTSFIKKINDSVYVFTPAHVIYNNVSSLKNYIMLDKGMKDGVRVDMGVVSPNGIVGIVMNVTANRSIVLPVLNLEFRLSCKMKNNNYFGSLVWDGKDPRYTYLQELPRHVDFDLKDTIVTSGYSSIFPEGLLVGTITDSQKQKNDNYNSLKIKLFTDFSTLNNVWVIKNRLKGEQENLQKIVKP